MVAACAFVSLNDAAMKLLSRDLPLGEILCLRGVVMLLMAFVLAWREGGLHRLRMGSRRLLLLRGVLAAGGMFLFVAGLRHLPLADAVAINFALPLFSAVLAVLVLRERLGWRRGAALLVGFAGIVVMVRPGSAQFTLVMLFPLGAALVGAGVDVTTRQLSRSRSSSSIFLASTAIICLAGLSTMPFGGWRTPSEFELGLLLLAGLLVTTSEYLVIEALRHGEVTLIAPFRYTAMVWAILFGMLIFGTTPDLGIVVGGMLVVASGVYIFRREATLVANRGGSR